MIYIDELFLLVIRRKRLVILPGHASYTMVQNDCQKCITSLSMQNPHCDEAALRCVKVKQGCHKHTLNYFLYAVYEVYLSENCEINLLFSLKRVIEE